MKLQKKFSKVQEAISSSLVEREEVVKGCLIAVLAKKHLFMVGPPGTAKSLGTEKVCRAITGANYFEWLMDMHTKPEDLFGPPMLSKLKQDRYERNTEGKLPRAHIAFLDEIWKASGSILNTLLRLLDESRKFYNDGETRTPLISLFGASNELPEDDSLAALYDRFLLRYYVGDIVDERNFKIMLQANGTGGVDNTLTLEEVEEAQAQTTLIDTAYAVELLTRLRREFKERAGLEFSPRRWKESLRILQAHAWLRGASKVEDRDIEILTHVLWNRPEERREASKIIFSVMNPDIEKALEIRDLAAEIHENAIKASNSAAGAEANDKLRKLLKQIDDLKSEDPKVGTIREEIVAMQRQVIVECLGFDA